MNVPSHDSWLPFECLARELHIAPAPLSLDEKAELMHVVRLNWERLATLAQGEVTREEALGSLDAAIAQFGALAERIRDGGANGG